MTSPSRSWNYSMSAVAFQNLKQFLSGFLLWINSFRRCFYCFQGLYHFWRIPERMFRVPCETYLQYHWHFLLLHLHILLKPLQKLNVPLDICFGFCEMRRGWAKLTKHGLKSCFPQMPRKNAIYLINKRPPSRWATVLLEMVAFLYAGRFDAYVSLRIIFGILTKRGKPIN